MKVDLQRSEVRRIDREWKQAASIWPNAQSSAFVDAAGLRWHIQRAGAGPTLLLLHGTGASSHTWHGMLPLLADHFEVLALDYPGHGFSEPGLRRNLSLTGMARQICRLLDALEFSPEVIIGHSAGAALAARMALSQQCHPRCIVGLNGAMLPFRGVSRHFFLPAARILSSVPAIPELFVARARSAAFVERLIRSTGSDPDKVPMDAWRWLMRSRTHVASTLGMMAAWDLDSLHAGLNHLDCQVELLVCEGDRVVLPEQGFRLARALPKVNLTQLPKLGHLGHEEAPDVFVNVIHQSLHELDRAEQASSKLRDQARRSA